MNSRSLLMNVVVCSVLTSGGGISIGSARAVSGYNAYFSARIGANNLAYPNTVSGAEVVANAVVESTPMPTGGSNPTGYSGPTYGWPLGGSAFGVDATWDAEGPAFSVQSQLRLQGSVVRFEDIRWHSDPRTILEFGTDYGTGFQANLSLLSGDMSVRTWRDNDIGFPGTTEKLVELGIPTVSVSMSDHVTLSIPDQATLLNDDRWLVHGRPVAWLSMEGVYAGAGGYHMLSASWGRGVSDGSSLELPYTGSQMMPFAFRQPIPICGGVECSLDLQIGLFAQGPAVRIETTKGLTLELPPGVVAQSESGYFPVVSSVPEPSTLLLAAAGMALVTGVYWRTSCGTASYQSDAARIAYGERTANQLPAGPSKRSDFE